jgi:hypothetical protein
MKSEILAAIRHKQQQDIVIIGKGPSIDKINTELLNNFIVLNINDSEAIIPGQICIFHHGWVLDRFDHHKPECNLYITDREMPKGTKRVKAQYVPLFTRKQQTFF